MNFLDKTGLQTFWNNIRTYMYEKFSIRNVTYDELIKLIDGELLTPGIRYRITDYVTTVDEDKDPEALSAEHPFDIIVLALTENTLSEEASAVLHKNDTYFTDCNLSAWKIWYCVYNDIHRFQWCRKDGRGVIYRMIDEHGNDCPYDFKNIMFKRYYTDEIFTGSDMRYNISKSCDNNTLGFIYDERYYYEMYTFHNIYSDSDFSVTNINALGGTSELYNNLKTQYPVSHNQIKPYYSVYLEDGLTYNVQTLNNIVFITDTDDTYSNITNNKFEENCYDITCVGKHKNNTFKLCYCNVLYDSNNCSYNNCYRNILSSEYYESAMKDITFNNISELYLLDVSSIDNENSLSENSHSTRILCYQHGTDLFYINPEDLIN